MVFVFNKAPHVVKDRNCMGVYEKTILLNYNKRLKGGKKNHLKGFENINYVKALICAYHDSLVYTLLLK